MAKLQLSVKTKLDITDNGEVIDTFNVTFREVTNKQQRKFGKDNKAILDLFKETQKIERQIETLDAQLDAYKELGKHEKLLEVSKKIEKLYDKQDKLETEFEKLGGLDRMLEASKASFDYSVGGEDKERLEKWIEENSDYAEVLKALADDAKAQKGNS